jgi:fumarate reductase iron-sulfur subunit
MQQQIEDMAEPDKIAVSVWRSAGAGGYADYQVPFRESQTVLDVVTYIQRHLDPTLAYRFACRVGVCGSCAMTVNGVPRWTCRTHVKKVVRHGALTIAPLQNMPVVKDLACDMSVFFEKWRDAEGRFRGASTRDDAIAAVPPSSPQRQAADAGIECINCGVCYSACDVVRWNDAYLGPAALNRAWTLQNDVRDQGFDPRLEAVAAGSGCHNCHSHQSCAEFCPAGLNPTRSIAGLKAMSVRAALTGRTERP